MKRFVPGIITFLALLLFFTGSCDEVEKMDTTEAYVQVYTAIEYKRAECGDAPLYPLFVPPEPPLQGANTCAFAITDADCPFNDYPLLCLELFENE